MRITKKYSGSSAVGKQTFVPCDLTEENLQAKARCDEELTDLQQKFLLALSTPSTADPTRDNYTLIADGSGSWISVDEHTVHFSKKSKIHKSASAPALNRMADGLHENVYIDRGSMTSMTSDCRTRANSLKAYAMDDTAAGNLLLDFFESVRSGLDDLAKPSAECSQPMSTIMEDGNEKLEGRVSSVSPLVSSGISTKSTTGQNSPFELATSPAASTAPAVPEKEDLKSTISVMKEEEQCAVPAEKSNDTIEALKPVS